MNGLLTPVVFSLAALGASRIAPLECGGIEPGLKRFVLILLGLLWILLVLDFFFLDIVGFSDQLNGLVLLAP